MAAERKGRVIDIEKGLRTVMDVGRYLPTPRDILRPLPQPQQGEMASAGVAADVISYGLGFIPWIGDILGNMANDNIMADVLRRLTPEERTEFREQNRLYPNGIALLRTFQRTRVAAEGGSKW